MMKALSTEALSAPRVRVGISGWNYPPWRGVFYPVGLRQADELAFAGRTFSSIEVNGSFYSLMRPQTYASWRDATPPDFVFAVKGGRFITHMKRLRGARTALANFFSSGLLCLGEKLGPILWQLPPHLPFDRDVLRAFFDLLPRDLEQLARLARDHDPRFSGRVALEPLVDNRPVLHTLEVRHPSFLNEHYLDLLRQYGIASCVADAAGLYPTIDEVTADFAYARLHGSKRLYVTGYGPKDLERWAARVRSWLARASSAYVFFDNDVKVRAPFDAINLNRLLAGQPPRRLPKTLASVLEEPRSDWPGWPRRPSARGSVQK